MNKRFTIFTLLTLLLGTTVLKAQTMEAVLRSIESNNLQLKALSRDNAAAVLDLKAENALAAPEVTYIPQYLKGANGVYTTEVEVTESFDFPTQYSQRSKRAAFEAEKRDHEYAEARREVLLDAELTCLDLIRSNQMANLLQLRFNDSEHMLTLVEKRMAAGDATALELNKVRLERMDVMKLKVQNDAERIALLQKLCELNGGVEVVLNDTVFPHRELTGDCEAFVQQALTNSAAVRVAESGLRMANHDVSASRQSWLPQLTLGYRGNLSADEALHGVVIGAAFPLFSTTSKVRAAKQRRESAELQLQDARVKAASWYRSRYTELQRIHSILDHSDTALLLETLALLNKAVDQGQMTAMEYYVEAPAIYDKLATHIDLHHQYSRLLAEALVF